MILVYEIFMANDLVVLWFNGILLSCYGLDWEKNFIDIFIFVWLLIIVSSLEGSIAI